MIDVLFSEYHLLENPVNGILVNGSTTPDA